MAWFQGFTMWQSVSILVFDTFHFLTAVLYYYMQVLYCAYYMPKLKLIYVSVCLYVRSFGHNVHLFEILKRCRLMMGSSEWSWGLMPVGFYHSLQDILLELYLILLLGLHILYSTICTCVDHASVWKCSRVILYSVLVSAHIVGTLY